jgi:transposase
VADRGYDSSAFRQALRRRGIRMCIPPKRRAATWKAKRGRPVVTRKDDYRQRFKVERSFAWLGNFRRLLIRWERQFEVYAGFFCVAAMIISLRAWERSRIGDRAHTCQYRAGVSRMPTEKETLTTSGLDCPFHGQPARSAPRPQEYR